MGYDYIVKVAKHRTLKKNQNFMICVNGPTGSGKSYTSISLALMIDKAFNVDRITFGVKDFIKASSTDLPQSSVIMFDEAGIEVASRDWQSDTNRAINQVAETFRRDNLVCVFTLPVFNHLDKKTRAYFHARVDVLDPAIAGWGAIKYFNLITNTETGDTMPNYPRIRDKNGRIVRMSGADGGRPNMWIVDPRKLNPTIVEQYEKKKKIFTDRIKTLAINELESKERQVKWELSHIVGHLAHNLTEYKIDELLDGLTDGEIKKKDITSFTSKTYTKLTTLYPYIKLTKSDVGSALEYILDSPNEARSISNDPFQELIDGGGVGRGNKKEYKLTELSRDKHYHIIRQWRLPPTMLSLGEVAKRLDMSFVKFRQQYNEKFEDIEEEVVDEYRKQRENGD